jgi:hypothetical protein
MKSRWILIVLAAAVAFPASLSAEIVRLPDGRFLQGEIVESDASGITFKRWDNGGVVRLAWEQINPDDRARLKKMLGLAFSDQEQGVTVSGYRIHLKTGDILEGVIVEETGSSVRIRRSSGEFTYPKDVIKRREPIEIDILSIYTDIEAYEQKVVEPPATPDEHYEIASWCRKIGYYEKEKEHLLAVQEGAPDFKPDFIRNRLEALETLVVEAQVHRRIKAILRLVARKKFSDAQTAWEELRNEFPDSDIVLDDTENVVDQIEQAKVRFTQSVVVKDWYANMRRIIRKKALDKEVKLADAKKWLHKELTAEIVSTISTRRGLDPEDIKSAFEERKVYSVYRGSYGTGSFIVEKGSRYGSGGASGAINDLGKRLGLDQASRDRLNDMFGGKSKSGSSKKKKALSPDDWWEIATSDMKYQWMMAYYAENSGDMEVVRVETKQCPSCRGKGYQSFLAAGGGASREDTGTQRTMCTRCQGLGKDRIVVFK